MAEKRYICYPMGLDDQPKEKYYHDGVDMEVSLCNRIATWFGADCCVTDDSREHSHEIIVGNCNRKEGKKLLYDLRWNQYAVVSNQNNVFVLGHCAKTIRMATEHLLTLSPEIVSQNYRFVGEASELPVDIPDVPFGKFAGMTDAFADRVQLVYNDVEPDQAKQYRLNLAEKGYRQIFSNRIENNSFGRYQKENQVFQVTYFGNQRQLRLLLAEESKWNSLPKPIVLGEENGTPVTLTQMTLDYGSGSYGMCYFIQLSDGSFVLIDGGHVRTVKGIPKTYDYVRLYTLLEEMNTRKDGKIVITAWMMTHDHEDHFKVFLWFCRYCKRYRLPVEIRQYYATPCSEAMLFNSKNPGLHSHNGDLEEAREDVGGFETYLLHTGDCLRFGAVSFEILYTVDDLFPTRLHYFNDSSLVVRMSYGEQNTLFLGDICETPSKLLRSLYTEKTLSADLVQVSHHGLNGAERELYDKIGAKVLLWSLREGLVWDMLEKEPTQPHQFLARHLINESGITEYFLHGRSNYTFTLPYHTGEDKLQRH